MKKISILAAILVLSGCYTTVPPAQDVYVEPYTAPTVYYTYPDSATQTTYVVQNNVPTTTYVVEQTAPDIVYVEQMPAYVYLDNPLIYGRPHHHYHHVAPRAHHTAPKPHHHNHHSAPAKQHHKSQSHNHHQGKPVSLVK